MHKFVELLAERQRNSAAEDGSVAPARRVDAVGAVVVPAKEARVRRFPAKPTQNSGGSGKCCGTGSRVASRCLTCPISPDRSDGTCTSGVEVGKGPRMRVAGLRASVYSRFAAAHRPSADRCKTSMSSAQRMPRFSLTALMQRTLVKRRRGLLKRWRGGISGGSCLVRNMRLRLHT